MAVTTAQQWRMLLAWLHRNFPAEQPITVRSKSLKKRKLCGETVYHKRWFTIYIHRNQCLNLRIDTLIHEWSHCLVWHGAEASEDHSSEWGIQYAKIYRTFLEWNWGKEHED